MKNKNRLKSTIFLGKNRRDLSSTIFLGKNRRGSHVGMIISFVVFVTFIVFLYAVLKPAINTGEDKETIADFVVGRIINNVSANFTTISVQMHDDNNKINKPCVLLSSFLTFLEIGPPEPLLKVKNGNGDLQEVYNHYPAFDPDLRINRIPVNNLFFKIYYSPKFNPITEGTTDCITIYYNNPTNPNDVNYTIGSMQTGKYIFEDNLNSLKDYYKDKNNYEELKKGLNIPPGTEFGFDFVQSNATKIEVGNVPHSANVYAEEIPIQYVDSSANILSGFINIKVW